MIEALREGKILILASDQNAGKRGEFVHFFGRPASSPRGPSFFHKKTGAAVITAFCHRKPTGNYELKFNRLPDDGAGTVMERFTSVLESEVRKRPAQYFWFHRRWKSFPKK
jgi:KDO2-lipid IV(A) lauroyltransferase